ncbi:MAG TPA: hypothetical protein PLJ10_13100 [Candidatus Hydrogenedens sp.]|nr:hypothetical protein [Candidatus Hydrogenedens sp.]HOL20961.1 hypothetical protein [Candidatus Hydrogenedens sp.]
MNKHISLLNLFLLFIIHYSTTFAENIALGVKYTLDPAPNYAHCKDKDDTIQLTDGKYVEGYFWTQEGTVGWSNEGLVIITIDLGKDMPIGGVSFSTAGGTAGVEFPKSIMIFTAGEDGIFHKIGDLIELNEQKVKPAKEGYTTYIYKTEKIKTHGRKVGLVIISDRFTFCDEIEVYKGDDRFINIPFPDEGTDDLHKYTQMVTIHNCVKQRITNDIEALRKITENLSSRNKQRQYRKQLDKLTREVKSLSMEYNPEFKTIFPINPTHEKVFNLLGKLWKDTGIHQIAVEPVDPYQYLELLPPKPISASDKSNQLHLEMMQNEIRSVAFNIASPQNTDITIAITGIPDDIRKKHIDVRKVLWTDTKKLEPVASALVPLTDNNGIYKLHITGGLIQQIWLTIHSKDLIPDIYTMTVQVDEISLPFTLKIYPIRFPDRPTLHMGGWDYTNVPKHYEVTEVNRTDLVNMLREYFVDSPWATSVAMPFGSYDDNGNMTAPPDTSNFDAWRQLWHDARQYCVFVSVANKLKNWDIETPPFNKAVAEWAKFWGNYMRKAGLDPSQLVILLVDEPHEHSADTIIKAWAKVIHDSGAGITIWEDPIYKDMSQALPEMIAECDVLCPNRQLFYSCGEEYRKFFVNQRNQGKKLEFYSCSGPMRLLDPFSYCRLQAWDCWRYGARATYFWAFADSAGASSWNDYLCTRNTYTPLFIDETSVTPGKHLEAMREGIEDYEYLLMLDKAIKEGKGSESTRQKAESLLRELPEKVLATMPENGRLFWRESKNPEIVDPIRQQILQILNQLGN